MSHEHIQTKPLEQYSDNYQQLAMKIFGQVNLPRRHYEQDKKEKRNGKKWEYKGSYSICSKSGDGETLGKIVIYQKQQPKRPEGVYIWLRNNGKYSSKIRGDERYHHILQTFDTINTMSVAPMPDESFDVILVNDETITDKLVSFLKALGEI